MINELVDRFNENKESLEAIFSEEHPSCYQDILGALLKTIEVDDYDIHSLDPSRVTEIDHGDYQGTFVYVIGAKGYQPSNYYMTKVDYGSCSGCDTLESITDYSSEKPTKEQVKGYMTLALHLLQKMKEM